MQIERYCGLTSALSLTNSSSTTARIQFSRAAGGSFVVTALATGVQINWYGALTQEGTAYPIYADGSASSTAIAANRAYPIPDACFGFPFIVPVLDAGTATIQASVKG